MSSSLSEAGRDLETGKLVVFEGTDPRWGAAGMG